MIHFLFLVSRQGKVRLTKWYDAIPTTEKTRTTREVSTLVLNRPPRNCNVIEWRDKKLVYKRYASLFFVVAVDPDDNELITLETVHHFVEVLDRYFGNVCELDIIFNFHKAYYLLDEVLLNGHLQEANKMTILDACAAQDAMMEESKEGKPGDR
uniref:AP complex subunit sigma n=1 Tax=Bicosoecida sp. CB-2014 TaxID=1486930 RepID=A0A7S1CCD6_9STRA|mmetsp:Transcript_19288/g.68152  ORF Transcript_19288/g.68152 Transcript_19288/m.68152 type:complete len:154 (+) Transcript_19288:57-518(+)